MERKGWIVVGTGSVDIENPKIFAAWCSGNEFPRESPDFSPFDTFDVIEHLLERKKYAEK